MADGKHWAFLPASEVLEKLASRSSGLSETEAVGRLAEYGLNRLPAPQPKSRWRIFLEQFQSPLIYILFAAVLAILAIGEPLDAAVIAIVLFFNAVLGTVQEGRAQNTLLALQKFVETKAAAMRDGREKIVSDSSLVPGDIIILQEGDKVPADGRLIHANNFAVEEAALTGEAEPRQKISEAIPGKEGGDLPPTEAANLVFKGTNVTTGRGTAIVTATGLDTLVGRISRKIVGIDTETPLKAKVRNLSRVIIAVAAVAVTGVFAAGLAAGETVREMFLVAVALGVSVIPEGLPVVMTLILAAGVWRMSRRQVLVKKLQAVDALGQAKILAVDKTGTITKNELVARQLCIAGQCFEIGGDGYEPKGDIQLSGKTVEPLNHPELILAGKIAAFCNSARYFYSEEERRWRIFGDPTEAAIGILAEKIGFRKDDLESESPSISEIPFDARNRYHLTVHRTDGEMFTTLVGAPEKILAACSDFWEGGKVRRLESGIYKKFEKEAAVMSLAGLRVLALAYQSGRRQITSPAEAYGFVFVGLVGIKDAVRPEAAAAAAETRAAGIRLVMITGDHWLTAQAIAAEVGIFREGDKILTGEEIGKMTDEELETAVGETAIFARVLPEDKLKIINAYRRRGEVVAMTGDGVNDALSLVAADLGVAMGRIGTAVAKEAADIILLDDNFGNIPAAVAEGRNIYQAVKKAVLFLFSTNLGEILAIAGAVLLGYPLPLAASQIIWLNFVTDGLLTLPLAMEPKDRDLLKGGFRIPAKYFLDRSDFGRMLLMGATMAVGSLWIFDFYLEAAPIKAATAVLTALAIFQWFNAWNCRDERRSIFQDNPAANKFLLAAMPIAVLAQILAVYHPWFQNIFHTVALTGFDWLLITGLAASLIAVEEIRKLIFRLVRPRAKQPAAGLA